MPEAARATGQVSQLPTSGLSLVPAVQEFHLPPRTPVHNCAFDLAGGGRGEGGSERGQGEVPPTKITPTLQ